MKVTRILMVLAVCALLLTGLLFSSGCSVPTDCNARGTGDIKFENHASHSTYDIIVDGSMVGSIAPGQSITQTENVGPHTILYRFSNTNQNACAESQESVIKCTVVTLSCSADQ